MLNKIREVWAANPDLRLGQLLVNAARPAQPCPELFYVEDRELVKRLEQLAARCVPPSIGAHDPQEQGSDPGRDA